MGNTQNRLQTIGLAAVTAITFGMSIPAAQAQSGNAAVVLSPGTVIPVKLNTELSSNQSHAGDTFTATVDDSRQAYSRIMQGATVKGIVRQANPQDGSTPGTLALAFTRLNLADGRSFTISGAPTTLDTKNLSTRSDGVLQAKTTKKDNRLTYAGIGAGAAVLADVLKGGKLKIGDILIGGALGYGAGTLLKSPQQVHDVDLVSGTPMGVLLSSTTRYYHRATPLKATRRHKATRG